MRGSVIESKCSRKVVVIIVTEKVLYGALIATYPISSIYNDLAVKGYVCNIQKNGSMVISMSGIFGCFV
jgi:hypothetical protein